MTPLILSLFLAQAPMTGGGELPPNHPPLDGTTQPPPGPVDENAPLPPNHPPIDGRRGTPVDMAKADIPSVEAILKKLDASPEALNKPRSFEISATIGRLYLSASRAKEAAAYLDQAVKTAEPARAFYLAQKKAMGKADVPDPGSVGCQANDASTLDSLMAKAKEHAAAGKAAAAFSCARTALHPLAQVETSLGSARFLLGDAEGALAVYDKSLATFDANPEARYARAALLLDTKADDLKALARVKNELESFMRDFPSSSRVAQARRLLERTDAALKAGGMTKLIASTPPPPPPKLKTPPMMAMRGPMQGGGGPMQGSGGPMQPPGPNMGSAPQVSQETMNAFQNVERTPELAANLAKMVDDAETNLAAGKYQDALNGYRGVMPLDPSPRVQAGMAWTLFKLGKPMADRVWMVASQNPAEIDQLGDRLKAKGDVEGAKALWQRLAQTVPAYASQVQGKL